MKRFFFLAAALFIAMHGIGGVAYARETPPSEFFGGGIPTAATTGRDFLQVLDNIVDWIFVVVLIGSVIFIVLAGWQFISGGGEPQAMSQARNKLLYAAIGIMVAVLSRGIVTAVRSLIGT